MNEFFGSVWWLIVSLGILVTFHEFGHYWVARRFGVRVLRFSVGFGKPLWSRKGKDGTEYVVAALPLGGYVKFLDDREVEVAPHERHESFNAKPVGQRIAIVAAGPMANLLLCVAFLWMMFVIGKPDLRPELGPATGIAAEAGFRQGDLVLAIGDRETPTLTDAGFALSKAVMDRQPTPVRVRTADGDETLRMLPLDRTGLELRESQPFADLGLTLNHPPVIAEVPQGGAAYGRLLPGDRIEAINGERVEIYGQVGPLLQRVSAPGEPLSIRVLRNGQSREISVDPRLVDVEGGKVWQLGILGVPPGEEALLRYGPLQAVPAAIGRTAQMTGDIFGMLGRMVTGKASLQNVSGPITIARVANGSANLGPAWFFGFLAILSLSLCIMNLLPIPVLDGGHLLYYLIELVKGSPVGERALVAGQYVGLVFLASLMGLAFYNDIFRPSF